MAHDLQTLIDKVIVVQQTIATPSGEEAIKNYYDEPPESIGVFPCFVNIEESMPDAAEWLTGGRRVVYLVQMHLLFQSWSRKYSVRHIRQWVRPVLDAFGAKTTLDGATGVAKSMIVGAEFFFDTPLALGQGDYTAVTFDLEIIIEEPFAWGV